MGRRVSLSYFVPTSKILLEDGTVKNIENIIRGEKILDGNGEAKTVININNIFYSGIIKKIYVSKNKHIECSNDSQFLTLKNINTYNLKNSELPPPKGMGF